MKYGNTIDFQATKMWNVCSKNLCDIVDKVTDSVLCHSADVGNLMSSLGICFYDFCPLFSNIAVVWSAIEIETYHPVAHLSLHFETNEWHF